MPGVHGASQRKERKLRPAMSQRTRQRTSEADSPTLPLVENTVAEGHRRRGCRSQHPPGPSGVSSLEPSRSGLTLQTRGSQTMGDVQPKLESRRQAKLHLSAPEGGRKVERWHTRESVNPKGARVKRRLQTSGRRIFSVSRWCAERQAIEGGVARSDHQTIDVAGAVRCEQKGVGPGRASVRASAGWSTSTARSRASRWKAPWFGFCRRSKPMAVYPGLASWSLRSLVSADWGVKTLVCLRKREKTSRRGVEAEPRSQLATEGARGPVVRLCFLSRWAQEVGGRRRSQLGDLRAAPRQSGAEATTVKSRAT
jgi:hypothetical protein